jgi:hypothetical protein
MWREVGLTCALLCAWIAENHAAYGPAKGHMIAQGSNEADLAANPVPTGVRAPRWWPVLPGDRTPPRAATAPFLPWACGAR